MAGPYGSHRTLLKFNSVNYNLYVTFHASFQGKLPEFDVIRLFSFQNAMKMVQ